MEKPKQYSIFKDHKFLCETDRIDGYGSKNYVVYIDTRYYAKLRLYNYMKKKEKQAIKARLTDILTAQIEKLVNSSEFDINEIFDIFQNVASKPGTYICKSDFELECKKVVLLNGGFLIESIDMVQEYELKQFCKEKSINILSY